MMFGIKDHPTIPYTKELSRQYDKNSAKFIKTVAEEERRDRILEDVFLRSSEENPYVRQVNDSIKICTDLREDARQRFLKQKKLQQLRINNEDLRELEVQLRTAYIKKGVAAQIYEHEALNNRKMFIEKEINNNLEMARYKAEEAAIKNEELKRQKNAALKLHLQDQITKNKAKRTAEYDALLKEREEIDELLRRFKEEDLEKERQAAAKKAKLQAEMYACKKDKELQKAAEKRANEIEDEKIAKYLKEKENIVVTKNLKMEERLAKTKISEEIGQRLHEKSLEKHKAHLFLVDLLVDERQFKEELEYREKLEEQKRQRAAALVQQQKDREEKERRKLAEQKLEESYLKEQMRVLAERDLIQQKLDEEKQRKTLEHRRDLQQALNEKQRLKARATKEMVCQREKELQVAEIANQLVEEERIRMLKQHVPGLLGFLAPCVLKGVDRSLVAFPPKEYS